MNKFEMMNVVSTSTLGAEDKNLLFELLLRMDPNTGECFPSVERLCKARGIKHERNFKGVAFYLPGLVNVQKRGRKNYYTINEQAVLMLEQSKITIKHTPAVAGVLSKSDQEVNTPSLEGVSGEVVIDTPSVAGVNTPAVAADTPAVAGAYSSIDTSIDSSSNNTRKNDDLDLETTTGHEAGRDEVLKDEVFPSSKDCRGTHGEVEDIEDSLGCELQVVSSSSSTTSDTPSTAGVLKERKVSPSIYTSEGELHERRMRALGRYKNG